MKLWSSKGKYNNSAADILKQLDACAIDFQFPMLDNGYIYPITSRMSSYRDDHRWALIIEVVGFNYRGGGHKGIDNCFYIFGNCLNSSPGIYSEHHINLTKSSDEGETFDVEYDN